MERVCFYMAKIELKDIKTCGVELAPGLLMVSNRLNSLLSKYQAEKGVFIDITNNLPKNLYAVDDIGAAFEDRNIRKTIAQAVQEDVNETGGNLTSGFYQSNIKLLTSLYLLTGLCYVSVESKDGRGRSSYLCTKNPFCLNYMLRYCNLDKVSDKRLDSVESKRLITQKELDGAYFEVIKFEDKNKDGGKFYLTTARLYPNSKKTLILPYTLASKRTDSIIERLKSGIFDISCRIAGDMRTIKGTLRNVEEYKKASDYTILDACVFPIIDLLTNEVVMLNALDIYTLKESCKGGALK